MISSIYSTIYSKNILWSFKSFIKTIVSNKSVAKSMRFSIAFGVWQLVSKPRIRRRRVNPVKLWKIWLLNSCLFFKMDELFWEIAKMTNLFKRFRSLGFSTGFPPELSRSILKNGDYFGLRICLSILSRSSISAILSLFWDKCSSSSLKKFSVYWLISFRVEVNSGSISGFNFCKFVIMY